MKTIATIATTLLLSLGLLVSPASAEETAPAIVWDTPLCDYAILTGVLNEQIDTLEGNVAQANKSVERLVRRDNMHRAKIAELRMVIRELRRESRG